MEELYRTMMDHGFLIYAIHEKHQSGPIYMLEKHSTPTDHRKAISVEGTTPTAHRVKFASFDGALERAKELIDWKEPPGQAAVQTADSCWFMQLLYHHRSGPKFIDLGEMGAVPYNVALEEAKTRAVRYIEESCEEEDVEGWDVKVRPRPSHQ